MGAPMALRLQACDHEVYAYNRSSEKLQPLAEQGIQTKKRPAEVVKSCDCTILMLSDAEAIADTVLTPETQAALSDRTLIQMGTISPNESRDLLAKVNNAGGSYLEAPVLGSIPQVQDGTLIVMVGSTADQFDQWQSLLDCFGKQVMHIGTVGAGAGVKLAMNQLIGSLTNAFSLSLALVQRENIDVETFMEIVRNSALYAPTFDKKLAEGHAAVFPSSGSGWTVAHPDRVRRSGRRGRDRSGPRRSGLFRAIRRRQSHQVTEPSDVFTVHRCAAVPYPQPLIHLRSKNLIMWDSRLGYPEASKMPALNNLDVI